MQIKYLSTILFIDLIASRLEVLKKKVLLLESLPIVFLSVRENFCLKWKITFVHGKITNKVVVVTLYSSII